MKIERILDYMVLSASILLAAILIYGLLTYNILVWRFFSILGEEELYVILCITTYILIDPDLGISLFGLVILSGSLNILLKELFSIPRPPRELWLEEVEGPGFPSGHTQVATSFWSRFSFQMRRKSIYLFSLICCTGIGLSRIMLRVHSIVDVLGGYLFGLTISLLTYMVWLRIPREKSLILINIIAIAVSVIAVGISEFYLETSWSLLGVALGLLMYYPVRRRVYLKTLRSLERIGVFIVTLVAAFTTLYYLKKLIIIEPIALFVYFAVTILIITLPIMLANIIERALAK